jgi:hypothetical protein
VRFREILLALALGFLLTGCLVLFGTYTLAAYDANGKNLTEKIRLVAEGSSIYPMRNALCIANPGATVVIRDAKTGEELKSESPYRCK